MAVDHFRKPERHLSECFKDSEDPEVGQTADSAEASQSNSSVEIRQSMGGGQSLSLILTYPPLPHHPRLFIHSPPLPNV